MFEAELVSVLVDEPLKVVEDRLDELVELGLLDFIGRRRYRLHHLLKLNASNELANDDETAVTEAQARLRRWLGPRVLSRPIAFAATTAAFAAFFVAAGAPTPLLPIYQSSRHFPTSMVMPASGVYVIALLLTLLVVGSLADHIGRRPMVVGALALELVSMLTFLVATSIGRIITARVLQGAATAAGTSSFSAAVLGLAPEPWKRTAASL